MKVYSDLKNAQVETVTGLPVTGTPGRMVRYSDDVYVEHSDGYRELVDTSSTQTLSNKTISITPTGSIAASNVYSALVELDGDITTANTNHTNHLNDTVDAHDASAISVTASGNLGSTDVQSALQELQGDIDTINTLADGKIYMGNASNVATEVSVTGDVSIANDGTASISSGVIVNADVNASAAIAYSKLNLSGSIVNADVSASAAIAHSKLANITAGSVLLGNASNVPTATALSGDVTVDSSGVTAISSGVIVNADVNASAAIARSKLAAGTASHVVINDGSGNFSSEATLAKSRGGAGADMSAVTFPSTGVIVTEGATQTLTAKTLSSPTLTTPVIDDGADFIEESSLSSPSSGRRRLGLKTDGKLYLRDSSGNEVQVGSGSSTGINYIGNPDAETNTTGWATYADAAASRPVDGTGGSPNSTWTRTTSTPLRSTASFLWSKTGSANRQGEGVSFDFTIARADRAKLLNISFNYEIVSGTYSGGTSSTDSDLIVYIYDVTNAALIEPSGIKLDGAVSGTQYNFNAVFQTASNSESYRLIIHTATTSTSDYTLEFDDFAVGPQLRNQGGITTSWASYTPTYGGLGTVTNNGAYWRRVGDTLEVHFDVTAGTTAASSASLTIPSGLAIDTTKITTVSMAGKIAASATPFEGGILISSVSNTVYFTSDAANYTSGVNGNTWANSTRFAGFFRVPILGWSSTTTLSSMDTQRLVAVRAYRASSDQTGVNPNASAVKIQINSVAATSIGQGFDTHAGFDGATNFRYTIPVAGVYNIAGGVSIASTNVLANRYQAQIYVNGSEAITGQVISAAVGTSFDARVAGTLQLKAGDYVELYLLGLGNNSASTLTARADAGATFLSVTRSAQNQTITAAETIAARYTSSVATSIVTGNVIPFATKDYDTHGAYNTGTGVFTAPAAGIYLFNVQVATSAATAAAITNVLGVRVNKNSAGATSYVGITYAGTTSSVNKVISGSIRLSLVAGDTIRLDGLNTTGQTHNLSADAEVNYLEIQRIGSPA